MSRFISLGAFLSLALLSCAAAEWKPLFDGKSLDGWTLRGGKAMFSAEDGVIVGRPVPGQDNSFLCTKQAYGDFILELEFKIPAGLNGGVQIRSQSTTDAPSGGKVFGYQIEMDSSKRAWSGGLYEEGRRGWLNDLSQNEAARKAFKPDAWNHFRIEAIGDSFKTFINGIPAADYRDAMNLSGFIGLQVHGTNSKAPADIRWRKLRIQDLGRHVWKPIFDGKTFNGWHPLPGGEWVIKDGIITGISPKSEPRHGLLTTDDIYKDFTVRTRFKVDKGDSGFYFRAEKVKGNVGVHGFQVEVDDTYETGGLYETGGRGWVIKYDGRKPTKFYRKDDWNTLVVSAHGRRVVVNLNGIKSAELNNDKGRTEGHIALQLHGSMDMLVHYKDIEMLVKE